MTKLFFFTLLLSIPLTAISQELLDVIHLNNGSVIKGTIIEENVGKNIKIRTRDGQIFVFKETEIKLITREKREAKTPIQDPPAPSSTAAPQHNPITTTQLLTTQEKRPFSTQLSFGYGNSFGGIGLSIQGKVGDRIALHAGGGYFPMSKVYEGAKDMFLVSGGFKIYFSKESQTLWFTDLQFGMIGGEYNKTTRFSSFSTTTEEEQQPLYGPSALLGGELFFDGGQLGVIFAGGVSYNLAEITWKEITWLGALDLGLAYRF